VALLSLLSTAALKRPGSDGRVREFKVDAFVIEKYALFPPCRPTPELKKFS